MKQIWRRIITIPLTMLIVSLLVFISISFSQGDSSAYILSEDAAAEEIEAYREAMEINDAWITRYIRFLLSFVSGNWGLTAGGQDIFTVIASRFPVTLSVSVLALVLSLSIALPLSYITLKEHTLRSSVATVYAVLVMSSPVFLTSLFLVIIFSVALNLFPVAGYVPLSKGIFLHLGSVFLPSLALALLHSSLLLIVFRRSLRENMKKAFSRVPVALGMKEWQVAVKSATKPSLPVLFVMTGESAAAFIGGSAAVESVFALPGLGSLLVSASLSRDVMLSGILLMIIALVISLFSVASELLSLLLDPRIRDKR